MSPVSETEVYLDGEGSEPFLVGTLRPSFTGGRNLASASFQYDTEYLGRTDAYAISPDLPLLSGRIFTPESTDIFGAFADASPDQWGQKIIEANHARLLKADPSLPRRLGSFDFLLGVSDYSRMGALRFRQSGSTEWLSSDSAVANLHELDRVLAAAQRYEAHQATDEDVAYLSDIATSPGGARPKANVRLADGTLAIAKLSHSKDGSIDVENWEALALTLAGASGIRTPRFHVYSASEDKSVLLLGRFDRTDSGGRVAYISAATALGIGAHDDTRITYEEFADTVAELSADAINDLHEMYRRIALSVLINNADDHWRNHGFLRRQGGWRLSPVFDVNPSPRQAAITSRAINDADDPRHRDIGNLLAIADAYALTQDQAADMIRMIAHVVDEWPVAATQLGISQEQQTLMARAFDEEQLNRAREIRPNPKGSRAAHS